MAYQIYQEPLLFQPAYNDVIFVVQSDNKAETNFKYIADVNVGGETIRLKSFPHPTYGSAFFNIGRIVETYVNNVGSDLGSVDTNSGFEINSNSFTTYNVHFGEEFGPSSGVITYPNITNTINRYVWNGLVDHLPFSQYDQNSYTSSNAKLLNNTNENLIRKINNQTNKAWLFFIQSDVDLFSSGIVKVYNSADVLIRHVTIQNPFNSSGTIGNHFLRFGVGPKNLNNISGTYIGDIVGIGNIIDSAIAKRYTIDFDPFDGYNQGSGLNIQFKIEDDDCKYTPYRLHWLNKLGAYESFTFTKKSFTETNIIKSKYKKTIGSMTSATTYGYAITDRGDRIFNTENKDTLYLKSDWLDDYEYILLQGLIESPEIYIESILIDSIQYDNVPVTCVDNKFTSKTQLNNKVFNLDIKLEFCFNRYSQRQ